MPIKSLVLGGVGFWGRGGAGTFIFMGARSFLRFVKGAP